MDRARDLLIAATCLAAFFVLPSCSQRSDLKQGLAPVTHPNIDALEPVVREQIVARQELLQTALDDPEASAETLAVAYSDLGKLYHAYRFFSAAIVCYRNAARCSPDDVSWVYLLAHAHRELGEIDDAVALLEEVLRARPDDQPALLWLAELYWQQGRLPEAQSMLERELALDADNGGALFKRGLLAAQLGDDQTAVQLLERAAAAQPWASVVRYPLAQAYLRLGDRERAEDNLRRRGQVAFAVADPLLQQLEEIRTGAHVYLTTGGTAMARGSYQQAADLFRRALAADPDSATARLNLGAALASIGQTAEAIEHLEAASRMGLSPGSRAKVLFNLATLHAQAGDLESAAARYREAIAADPTNLRARQFLGRLLHGRGEYSEALEQFRAVAEADPSNSEAHSGVASSLFRMGRFAECRQNLESALTLLPEDPKIADRLAQLLAACPDDTVRDGQRAVELARRLLDVHHSPLHALTLAMAYAETGSFAEAVKLQRAALQAIKDKEPAGLVARVREDLARYQAGLPCRRPRL